jgi:hypothetical protein
MPYVDMAAPDSSTIDDPGVPGQLLYARPSERRPACGAHSCGSAGRRRFVSKVPI